ncbi:MAG: hypothetical protein ABH863_00725 [Candidatus Micrarchaeota archaeon]
MAFRKKIQPKGDEPIYINIPSVRSSITPCLAKWFVHAIEAKAGNGIIPVIDEVAKSGIEESLRKGIIRIKSALEARRLVRSSPLSRDIHFVVVDNASYHWEKPIKELHTPHAIEFARLLNRIGNKYGVFVHYITRNEMETIHPSDEEIISREHPLFHSSITFGGLPMIKTSPGAASNIGLAYIRGIHFRHYSGNALFIRRGDDMFPTVRRVKWETETREFRNFFHDMESMLAGNVNHRLKKEGYGQYGGYDDSRGVRVRKRPLLATGVRLGDPKKLTFYSTRKNEDMFYMYPGSRHYPTPSYLVHAGKHSTWDRTEYNSRTDFGKFGGYKTLVEQAPSEFVGMVLKNSRVRMVEGRK